MCNSVVFKATELYVFNEVYSMWMIIQQRRREEEVEKTNPSFWLGYIFYMLFPRWLYIRDSGIDKLRHFSISHVDNENLPLSMHWILRVFISLQLATCSYGKHSHLRKDGLVKWIWYHVDQRNNGQKLWCCQTTNQITLWVKRKQMSRPHGGWLWSLPWRLLTHKEHQELCCSL